MEYLSFHLHAAITTTAVTNGCSDLKKKTPKTVKKMMKFYQTDYK